MEYFTEASLSDSAMFQQLNASSTLMSKIAKAIKNGAVLDKSYFETQYLQISKAHISPIADQVLKAFDDGKIKLVYNKNDHVTIALPFVVLNIGGKTSAYIFINEFSSMTKEGSPQLTIDMKKLYTLLESAFVGLLYFAKPKYFTRNATFIKAFTNIYSLMSMRILNREYALSLTKDLYDATNYYVARFFLEKIIGVTNKDVVNSYAAGTCNNPSETTINLCNATYSTAKVNTINDFVKFIYKNDLYITFLEVDYKHATEYLKFKSLYERLYREKDNYEEFQGTFPIVIVANLNASIRYNSSNFNVIYTTYDYDNLSDLLL